MDIQIRTEQIKDHQFVFSLIECAFSKEEYSDHKEHHLVERLRNSTTFIPELSLVALYDNIIVGHILLSKITIKDKDSTFPSLALAPVSVHPNYQNKGIGGKLILESHEIAKKLKFKSIVLLGHEKYYPKFGYKMADKYGITFPFEAPLENCMVIELFEDGLKDVKGEVQYPKEFFL